MLSLLRGACKSCQTLQCRTTPIKGWRSHYKVYNFRCIASSSDVFNKSVAVKKQCGEIYDSVVQDGNVWANIQHNIVDAETFEFLKERYNERIQEINSQKIEEVNKITSKSKAKKKAHKTKPTTSKFVRGSQLTYKGEQSVLAEIDIYLYLGDLQSAVNLFNYHRRHGHKFNIEGYNKMIHAWASHKSWKNIQLLLRNMKREELEPNYQTYAGLLEACGNLDDVVRTESVISEMEDQGIDVHQILLKSSLTKQQVLAIVHALGKIYPNYLNQAKTSHTSVCKSTISHLRNNDAAKIIKSQIDLELKGSLEIPSIDVTKVHSNLAVKRSHLYQTIIDQWRKDFITELVQVRKFKNNRAFMYNRCVTFASVLTPDELADILFDNIVPLICSQPQGIPVNFICRRLGRMIYSRFCAKFKNDNGVVEKVQGICEEYTSATEWIDGSLEPRKKWNEINSMLPYLASEDIAPTLWPTKIKAMASSVVLDILKKVATIDTSIFLKSKRGKIEPSLSHHHEFIGHHQIGILKFHPTVGRLYSSYLSQLGNISFEVNKLPICIPPRPWTSSNSGAYLLLHSDLVRTVTGEYKLNELSNASKNGDIDQIFDCLNYLGNCAWKVNERILDIMIDLFNGDGDMKLDIIGPKLPYVEQWKSKRAMTLQERKSRQRRKKLYHELFALRMDQLYKLSVSNYFRHSVFWIPNNLDFRGRIYPIAPHCSHIGSDVSRGLLLFADGKPLGKKGLDWLKVHLVNVHGQLKKSSLQERIEFVDRHIDDVMDSTDNPLTGRKWWQDGSDPWQTLVACMELTDAIRSGDPENFFSHIPVHQDGSCNGLQHYAGLGRDEYGAKQVNLMPSDRPQDVYMEVANLVEKTRVKDAADGLSIAQLLEGKVTRKVVKQTVMTVVYGVTFVGGRLQIEKQLKELGVGSDIIFKASVYVVQEVFKSLTEMFTSARLIQDWLTISAAQIALTGNCVDWVTPLGLPVIQPYHRETTESISTPLQTVSSSHYFDYTQIPNLTKQKGGFPPNFIHSLDSSHLMLTALRCQKHQMTFASVHDSFWSHACDVDLMNKFCREEFVALHQLPILDDLKQHFDRKFAGKPLRKPLKDGTKAANFNALPEQGSFDIKRVLDSVYFFS